MTGHQAEFWHPGILAKYLAADAFAAGSSAAVAWIVVDQERPDSAAIRYPHLDAGSLSASTLTLRAGECAAPAGLAPDFVARGLRTVAAAIERHAGLPSFSRTIAAALDELMGPLLTLPRVTLFASELARATLFRELVAKMAADPEACCAAYNAAAARHPAAGIRALVADPVQDRWELPLWHLPPGRERTHVYAEDLPSIPPSELAPKALFMTGLLRLAACDLFIHGTGGAGLDDQAGYDRITDEWLAAWLGINPADLAPITTVTATRLLPLPIHPPTARAVDRSVWLAHAAPHNPHIIRDGYYDDAKRTLVLQIAKAPRPERRALYRRMHTLLDEYRATHAADLAAIAGDADQARARLAAAPILADRTWAFPLYPPSVLASLRDEVRAAFNPS